MNSNKQNNKSKEQPASLSQTGRYGTRVPMSRMLLIFPHVPNKSFSLQNQIHSDKKNKK